MTGSRSSSSADKQKLQRIEWDFEAVQDDQLHACVYWEYARESAMIRAFASPRDSDFFPSAEMRPAITAPDGTVLMHARRALLNQAHARFFEQLRTYALPVKLILDRISRKAPDPFEQGWVKLSPKVRRHIVDDLQPYFAEKPALAYLPFNRCSDMRDIGLTDESYRCAELDIETGIERLRVEIAWGEFTDKQIVAAFRTWVGENRPRGVGREDDKGRRKGKGLRNHLAWLGTMRLMNAYPYTRMTRCCPEAATFYATVDWPRSRQKAGRFFRELFPFLPESDKPIHWRTAGGRGR